MENWEFLFQKEGSHLWTPITSSTWQLDEGKYRIMAHSSQGNFKTEIRVTYKNNNLESEIETIYQGCRNTNSQGLIMILPLTELKAGIWEIRCYGDLMSELLGRTWQKRLQIEVLSEYISSSAVNEQDTPEADSIPLIKGVSQYRYSNKAADLAGINHVTSYREHSHQINLVEFQANTKDYYQQLQQLLKEEIEPQLTSLAVSSIPLLRLGLNQDTFIRSLGESILLSGTVEAEEIADVSPTKFTKFSGKFRYQLIEPHTEEILLEIEEDIQEQILPFMFNYALEVPNEWEIPLLVGEVSLETLSGVKIDYQSFTVTTDLTVSPSRSVNYTITLSNAENNASFAFDLFLDNCNTDIPLNVDLPEPAKMGKTLTYYSANSTTKLPPKIAQVSHNNKTVKSVQLPTISASKPLKNNPNNKPSNIETESLTTSLENPISENNQSFELLNLQEKFISRLNSLSK